MAAALPDSVSLYVHVPFCTRRCHYCDFAVTASADPPIRDWLEALAEDLNQWQAELGTPRLPRLDTIFVGGGTPSLLGAAGMEGLRRLLEDRFPLDPGTIEWTAEANPNSLTLDTARAWREAGVNRLSLGVQSFDDRALQWLGRLHDRNEASGAIERARAAGFENLSIDLIFGLPTGVARSWRDDLEHAMELAVPHLSAYGLTAEHRTALGSWVSAGRVQMPDQEQYEREYLTAVEILEMHDLKHYEVSNFATSGHECRHNWHYWIGSEYLGVGPSSHSFVGGRRSWNVREWSAYRLAARERSSVREGHEEPTPEQRRLESLWLGLRTRRGIELARFGIPERAVASWIGAGRAVLAGGRLRLTSRGWLLLDELVTELSARDDEAGDPVNGGRA
jgi:oxygen-independent coproporphyrinogen-3 oxidase